MEKSPQQQAASAHPTAAAHGTLPAAAAPAEDRRNAPRKKIKLALQGGGAHGAFAWGVLDRLLEDDRIEIECLVGTSAGAMNAAVTAFGLATGGREKARELLRLFWTKNAEAGSRGPLKPTALDKMMSRGNMDYSPAYAVLDMLSKVMSPYELNPQNINPLKDIIAQVVDFDVLRKASNGPKLFVCATNVLTGRMKVFGQQEITPDAVMASACLPFMFQSVEIDGEFYWDGGYSGNPPIFPIIANGSSHDIMIVQINPINIPDVPRTARAILDRVNTLSFNSSLMREMRAIYFVTSLLDKGELDPTKHKRHYIHTIDAESELAQFGVSSKLNPSLDFLEYLHRIGRRKASKFLQRSYDAIGRESTCDMLEKFF